MKLLALEASTDACSAALWLDGETFERFDVVPRGHTDLILPMVESLMAESGLTLADMEGIAFARGPGAFTGVRIATGVVQGLAYAMDLPVIPISTLAALAQGAWREHGWEKVVACLDARMNEVYWGAYIYKEERMQAMDRAECVCPPEQAPLLEGEGWAGVGSGWEAYETALVARYQGQLQDLDKTAYPHAQDIAVLAAYEAKAGNMLPAEQALPVYLRDQVVHKN